MGRRAPNYLMRPRKHFANVEVQVLAALGDGAVSRPNNCVGDEQERHSPLATRRIDQRVKEPGKRIPRRFGGFRTAHQRAAAGERISATAAYTSSTLMACMQTLSVQAVLR